MSKKLYRNTNEAMFSGVAAGLSDYLGLDTALWRLGILCLIVVTSGAFLLVYLAAWIIVPARPAGDEYKDVEYTVSE